MPEQPFPNLTLQKVSAELGSLHLMIINLQGEIDKILSVPGVKEAIEAHNKNGGTKTE
jgi:hypothetical protein